MNLVQSSNTYSVFSLGTINTTRSCSNYCSFWTKHTVPWIHAIRIWSSLDGFLAAEQSCWFGSRGSRVKYSGRRKEASEFDRGAISVEPSIMSLLWEEKWIPHLWWKINARFHSVVEENKQVLMEGSWMYEETTKINDTGNKAFSLCKWAITIPALIAGVDAHDFKTVLIF